MRFPVMFVRPRRPSPSGRSPPAFVRWFPATAGVNGSIRLSQMGASRAEVWPEWSWLWTLAIAYFALAWVMESFSREPAAAAQR